MHIKEVCTRFHFTLPDGIHSFPVECYCYDDFPRDSILGVVYNMDLEHTDMQQLRPDIQSEYEQMES